MSDIKYIGIDVGKLDLHAVYKHTTRGGKLKVKYRQFANDPKGISALSRWAKKSTKANQVVQFCMEATGSYHELCATMLHDEGLRVSVLNPARTKAFGESIGVRTKTDAKDAHVLAEYGEALHPPLWEAPLKEYRKIMDFIRAIESRQKEKVRILNRIESFDSRVDLPAAILVEEERVLKELEASIKRLEGAIEDHIDNHPNLKSDVKLVATIKGVGLKTSYMFVSLMSGGSRFGSAREAASYVGLSVKERKSGTSVRGTSRLSKRGDSTIRKALYWPAITATRYNADVKALYVRLLAKGKPKMVAIGAAMRKLVHIAFGVLKNRTPYIPQVTVS
jgi:transposase